MKITFYLEQTDLTIEINDADKNLAIFRVRLLSIFSEPVNQKGRMKLDTLQRMTSDIRKKINELIENFIADYPRYARLLEFKKNFNKISDGDFFFIIPAKGEISIKMSMYLFSYLSLANKGMKHTEIERILKKQMNNWNDLFGKIHANYRITIFNPKRKTRYGVSNKKQRICRYCNGTLEKGNTFKYDSHTIPEAIGNKNIISLEECDQCNKKFEASIEKDLIEFFKIYRVFYGIKGKKSIPKEKFRNEIILENNGSCKLKTPERNHLKPNADDQFKIPLVNFQKINMTDVYRSLVKSVIGLISPLNLPNLQNTISWVNKQYRYDPNTLPKIAVRLEGSLSAHPILTIYEKFSNDESLPLLVAELKIMAFVYVFIVPFVSTDNLNFREEKNFNNFWNTFHYSKLSQWSFQNFCDDIDRNTIFDLKIQQK